MLTSNFISEIIEQLYQEATAPREVFAVYPGRFQPPGPHHFKTFEWLEKKFGRGKVFVATSAVVDPKKSPLSFQEKKAIWEKYGVPSDRIVQVKNPYSASEILDNLPEDSAVVFAYGKKDAERFNVGKKKDGSPSYLQWYEPNKDNLEDHLKNSYLVIAPHMSVKIGSREMSGTEIRELIANDTSPETFKSVFGWYDPTIHDLLVKKFTASQLTEGGNMFDEEVSMVKQENADAVIKQVLQQNGIGEVEFSKIGNYHKPLLGDIDIAIDTQDILKILNLPSNASKDELFDALAEKLPDSAPAKGLYQFSLKGEAKGQPFIHADGSTENKPALIQVDVMLGSRRWREKSYSGAPDSAYKAKFRNIFISEIFAEVIEEEGGPENVKRKYMVTPAEGFFLQRFTTSAKGKRKELSREFKSDDMDFVAKFLFGDDKTFSDIDTFEKVYALFKSDDFKFPEFRQKIIDAYKKTLDNVKLQMPNVQQPLLEKQHIQRFSGPNEMTDTEFLEFLKRVQPMVKAGKIDLEVSDSATVTEKLDGSPCVWGLDEQGRFFVESANSGPVTLANADKLNNPFTSHFYEALKFLSTYKPFQLRLQKAAAENGSFRVTSEMFPVLTHKGDAIGDIVFCSTRYNKKKLGEKGAFVCFSAEPDVLSIVAMPDDPMWKVYDINTHGTLPKQGLVFDLTGVSDLVENPTKLQSAIDLLRTRGKSVEAEKDAMRKVVRTVKDQLQGVLNRYAEQIGTFLGSSSSGRKYPVEGVVLKVKAPGEDIFIKGTSTIFHKIAEKTWGTRHAAGDAEKVLDGKFLTDVLGLSTSHSATLNKAVQTAKAKVPNDGSEKAKNEIALAVYNQLKGEIDLDPKALKQRGLTVLKGAAGEVANVTSEWNRVKETGEVDPDTIKKTEDQLDFLNDRLRKIAGAIKSPKYQGIEYVVYLLRLFIDKRIGSSDENG